MPSAFEYSEDEASYFGMPEDEMEGILSQTDTDTGTLPPSTGPKRRKKKNRTKELSDEECLEPFVILLYYTGNKRNNKIKLERKGRNLTQNYPT